MTPDLVRQWYATTAVDQPTLRSYVYGLLRMILGQAVRDELLRSDPCHLRALAMPGAPIGLEPDSLTELHQLAGAMPKRYRAMVLLSSRFSELTEPDLTTPTWRSV